MLVFSGKRTLGNILQLSEADARSVSEEQVIQMRAYNYLFLAAIGFTGVLIGSSPAPAATLTTLIRFGEWNGANPMAALTADAAGRIFGVTTNSGYRDTAGGTLFRVAPNYAGGAANLVRFNQASGMGSTSTLLLDAAGNLFGTTNNGGAFDQGTVFKVAKVGVGYGGMPIYATTPTVLVNFSGANGARPAAGVIMDAAANLFGVTSKGGPKSLGCREGCGTVFLVEKTASGYSNAPKTLAFFNGTGNGNNPNSELVTDGAGNIYGTTWGGGAKDLGTVFTIPRTPTGYGVLKSIVQFDRYGRNPSSGVLIDAAGDLIGSTLLGGPSNSGTIFKIAKTASGYASGADFIAKFNGANGGWPGGRLITDGTGNLYGTARNGGAFQKGTVYKITKTPTGYDSNPTPIVHFSGFNGAFPRAGLLADGEGNLYGTTVGGGWRLTSTWRGLGVVYKITGSGFVARKAPAGIH